MKMSSKKEGSNLVDSSYLVANSGIRVLLKCENYGAKI